MLADFAKVQTLTVRAAPPPPAGSRGSPSRSAWVSQAPQRRLQQLAHLAVTRLLGYRPSATPADRPAFVRAGYALAALEGSPAHLAAQGAYYSYLCGRLNALLEASAASRWAREWPPNGPDVGEVDDRGGGLH